MIAEASNDGNQEQGGSPMDLASHASQADQPDHGTSSGPAAESVEFPPFPKVALLGLTVFAIVGAVVIGGYIGGKLADAMGLE